MKRFVRRHKALQLDTSVHFSTVTVVEKNISNVVAVVVAAVVVQLVAAVVVQLVAAVVSMSNYG